MSRISEYEFEVDALQDRINELEEAIREFCRRVENGEVRSTKTYQKFKVILGEQEGE